MRFRRFVVLSGLVLALFATPAHAQDEGSTTTATEEGVAIGDGYSFTGAVITPLEGGETRTLDAYQAAVFVQSWLGQAIFAREDILKEPSPELPVYRVDIQGDWGDQVGRVTVYYATDGTTPYIAFPQTQGAVTDPNAPYPEPADWFVGVPRVIDAFEGNAELIETTGTQMATSTTTTPGSEQASGSSDDSTSPPVWVWAVAAAVVIIAGGLVLRARRSLRASPPAD